MGADESLSFVLPFRNEVDGAARCLDAVCSVARDLEARGVVSHVEVVAVDDGSTDGTGPLLDQLAAADDRIRPVHHERNGGLGAALRTGFGAATGTWIFYTDSDLPVDPLVAERALRAAELHQADIVSCFRLDRTAEGLRRSVLSAGYNLGVRVITGLTVRDVNFAAKLVRRSMVVDDLPVSDSLFFDAELLLRAIRHGAQIQQIGVDYFVRSTGQSTLSSPSVVAATAKDLIRIGPKVRIS